MKEPADVQKESTLAPITQRVAWRFGLQFAKVTPTQPSFLKVLCICKHELAKNNPEHAMRTARGQKRGLLRGVGMKIRVLANRYHKLCGFVYRTQVIHEHFFQIAMDLHITYIMLDQGYFKTPYTMLI